MNDKKKIFLIVMAIALIAMVSVAVMPVSASYWSSLTDEDRNQLILNEAQGQIGNIGGQCKEWVQDTVWYASWYTRWLPQNYYNPSSEWHLAKWYDSSGVEVVCKATEEYGSYPLRSPDICDYWWMIKPGQIIQMRHNDGGITPHTVIVKSATPWGFSVIDSNWNGDLKVRQHWISVSWFEDHTEAWTVYQVK